MLKLKGKYNSAKAFTDVIGGRAVYGRCVFGYAAKRLTNRRYLQTRLRMV